MTIKTVLSVVLALAATSALGQDAFRAQVFGGYSLQSYDSDGLPGLSRKTFHGWNAELQGNISRHFGVVADFGGYYKAAATESFLGSTKLTATPPGVEVDMAAHTFMAGPRFTYRVDRLAPFAHAVFGVARFSVDLDPPVFGLSHYSTNDFAWAIGGGLGFDVGERFALRPAKLDYLGVSSGTTLNNWRYSGGVVVKF